MRAPRATGTAVFEINAAVYVATAGPSVDAPAVASVPRRGSRPVTSQNAAVAVNGASPASSPPLLLVPQRDRPEARGGKRAEVRRVSAVQDGDLSAASAFSSSMG